MTRDLESALREARGLCKRARMLPASIGVEQLLARIDAALSAASGGNRVTCFQSDNLEACLLHPACGCVASGEASGDDLIIRQLNDLLHFQNALIEAAGMPEDLSPEEVLPWFISRLKVRPAPSEAPNVERPFGRMSRAQLFVELLDSRRRVVELEKERDSARAEGIAAERERIKRRVADNEKERDAIWNALISETEK